MRRPLLFLLCVLGSFSSGAHAQSFTPRRVHPLNINAATDWGEDSHPQVATDGSGHWVAVWDSNDSLGGTTGNDADIMVARSTNNGRTWTFPAPVDTNATMDENRPDSFPEIATDSVGNWLVVWQWIRDQAAAINEDYDILEAHSTDNGASWSTPQILNTNGVAPQPYARLNSQPDLATNGVGTWLSVWKYRDMPSVSEWVTVFAISNDNGQTWSVPEVLLPGGTMPSRFEENPRIISDGLGAWIVSWTYTGGILDSDIFVSRSANDGASWSPAVAVNTDAGSVDSLYDRRAFISSSGDGMLVAVWERWDVANLLRDTDIAAAVSLDGGTTWSSPQLVNSNWLADENADDSYPHVANDGSGNWISVWQSNRDFGGNPSWEGDALVTRWSTNHDDGNGDCFIATAAYGTPLAPELKHLRAFRDGRLLTNPVGSAMADLYYRLSPPAAEYIAVRPAQRYAIRSAISAIISLRTELRGLFVCSVVFLIAASSFRRSNHHPIA